MTTIDQWIAQQCADIKQSLAGLIHAGQSCALIGYPDHWNAGDMAIWSGTVTLLNDLGSKIKYVCDPWNYDPEKLNSALPYGPILLHGGGNFGDIYADEIYLRKRILQDFPHRKIIQLPQSIWFRDTANVTEMAQLLEKQKDFTLLVRDKASQAFSEKYFGVKTILSPDYAVYLSDLQSYTGKPETDYFALCRDDIETERDAHTFSKDIPTADWMTPGPETAHFTRQSRAMLKLVSRPVTGNYECPVSRAIAWKFYPLFWNALAQDRIKRGCEFLSRGKIVITDRLHGHLLSLLMRKPHVVCDNGNNKIRNYTETWPLDSEFVIFEENREDAERKAKDLAARITGP